MKTNLTLEILVGTQNKTHFAKKHNISRRLLAMWLSNDRNIKITTLERIAKNEGYKLLTELILEKL